MSAKRLDELKAALALKREHRGTELEKLVDSNIVALIVAGMTEGMHAVNQRRRDNAANRDFQMAAESLNKGRKRRGVSDTRVALNAAMRLSADLEWRLQSALKPALKPARFCFHRSSIKGVISFNGS